MNAVESRNRIVANELVAVYETESGEKVVDGRELHEFLKVSSRYNDWLNARVNKYEFIEGEDFITLTENLVSGGKQNRHILKLDTAKELCMVENNEQGSRARKYFIEVERRFKNQQFEVAKLSPTLQMFHALFQSQASLESRVAEAENRAVLAESKAAALTETVDAIQEAFLQRDEDWRRQVNSLIAGAAFRTGSDYRNLRNESYRSLEERGHCDLDSRLRNLVKRLEDSGATKTQVKNTNKMDVIEADPKLKEIYSTVVKELSIGSLRVTSAR